MIKELILKNRSYRRFNQDIEVKRNELIELIDLARLSPSPRNQQALKYIISNDNKLNCKIFEQLVWAGALPNWEGPEEGERPLAYIIILGDNSLIGKNQKSLHESASGIAAQSIMLGAVEKGFGGCMIAAIKRKKLREVLKIADKYEILLVLALGNTKEKIVIEKMPENGNFNYWRDEKNVHHVPKRDIDNIIL